MESATALSPPARPRRAPPPGYIAPAASIPIATASTSTTTTPSTAPVPSIASSLPLASSSLTSSSSSSSFVASPTAPAVPCATPLGQRMLKRMGWTEGTGLGAHRQGRVEAVKASSRSVRCKRGLIATEEQQEVVQSSREAELRAKSLEMRLSQGPRDKRYSAVEAPNLQDRDSGSESDSGGSSLGKGSLSELADFYQKGCKRGKKSVQWSEKEAEYIDPPEPSEIANREDFTAEETLCHELFGFEKEEEEEESEELEDEEEAEQAPHLKQAPLRISGLVKRELYYQFSAANPVSSAFPFSPSEGFSGPVGFRDARERRALQRVLSATPGKLSDFVTIR